LDYLKGLPQLQTLDLEDTEVTDAGVGELRKVLPKTEIYPCRLSEKPN